MQDPVFDYDEINLIPRKCIVGSRKVCDTRMTLGKHTFKLPVVPANMECVINPTIAEQLAKEGYFYVYHRFHGDTIQFAKNMYAKALPVSISIGVHGDSYKILSTLYDDGIVPDSITIDVAHGHSIQMEAILKWIRLLYRKEQPFVIAGNVSTAEGTRDLEAWGADAIKVGIGPGSACTTYNATGFGSRGIQASAILTCAKARQKSSTKIIADGGIRDPGDIAKSLVLGADCVMIGGMFSGLTDSPGPTVRGTDGILYKEFWGSASEFQTGKQGRVEGTKKLIPLQSRSFEEMMRYLTECLQSAISYGGGEDLSCFRDVKWCCKK